MKTAAKLINLIFTHGIFATLFMFAANSYAVEKAALHYYEGLDQRGKTVVRLVPSMHAGLDPARYSDAVEFLVSRSSTVFIEHDVTDSEAVANVKLIARESVQIFDRNPPLAATRDKVIFNLGAPLSLSSQESLALKQVGPWAFLLYLNNRCPVKTAVHLQSLEQIFLSKAKAYGVKTALFENPHESMAWMFTLSAKDWSTAFERLSDRIIEVCPTAWSTFLNDLTKRFEAGDFEAMWVIAYRFDSYEKSKIAYSEAWRNGADRHLNASVRLNKIIQSATNGPPTILMGAAHFATDDSILTYLSRSGLSFKKVAFKVP